MTQTARFIPAKELSRQLAKVIEPQLRSVFPELPFSLALIGPGSDVLGYDTARSMDHDWGPRLTILVPHPNVEEARGRIESNLESFLPPEIAGFSTRFSHHADGTMKADPEGMLHRLEVSSQMSLLRRYLLIDAIDQLSDAVWLSTPMQSLLELTAGEVFVDDSNTLASFRLASASSRIIFGAISLLDYEWASRKCNRLSADALNPMIVPEYLPLRWVSCVISCGSPWCNLVSMRRTPNGWVPHWHKRK